MEVDGSSDSRVVAPAPVSPRGPPAKMPREDVLELARQLNEANNFVQANACNRLKPIVDQMKFLREQAVTVLESVQRDHELHQVQCSFPKVPGHMYHLYEREDGTRYFSMLSPEEWGHRLPANEHYVGSFRLEADQSWTNSDEVQSYDQQMVTLRGLAFAGRNISSNIADLYGQTQAPQLLPNTTSNGSTRTQSETTARATANSTEAPRRP